jgi:hypothetical protein
MVWVFDKNGTKLTFDEFNASQSNQGISTGDPCQLVDGIQWCYNEVLQATCTKEMKAEYEWCEEEKGGEFLYFAWQDNQRFYYDFEKETFTPSLNYYFENDFYWELDLDRNEYCTFDENMYKICYNEDQDNYCRIIEDGTVESCSKDNLVSAS